MSDQVCNGCGKSSGTGTLLDEFSDPPLPHTSLHRLYLIVAKDISPFEGRAMEQPIDQEVWETFASTKRCLVCAEESKESVDE